MNFVGALPVDKYDSVAAIDHQYSQTLCELSAVPRPANSDI